MNDNVVDASDRFGAGRQQRANQTVWDRLRGTTRVLLEDRPLLASRLGEIAEQIAPGKPRPVAKEWFKRAWPSSDRWAKRKRLICFPGETAPEPHDEGAYVASGADWAALIDQAARTKFPADGGTGDAERARLGRDILRGTTFLPALDPIPLQNESAQSLLVSWAEKITYKIESDSDLCRLWDLLKTTPFGIYGYDLERPDPPPEPGARFEGDIYSAGPLGAVSKRAAELYEENDRRGWRFELEERSGLGTSWAFPRIRLGLRGHQRKGRIFVIPDGFWKDLPPDNDFEHGEGVFEWLVAKGLISRSGVSNDGLPEIPFNKNGVYGWREFAVEYPEDVWLEARPKDDGTTGLWLYTSMIIYEDFYPAPTYGFDPLAQVAELGANRSQYLVSAWDDRECEDYHWPYHIFTWPTADAIFSSNGEVPHSAVSGIVDLDLLNSEGTGGWVDDLDNSELQDILFGNSKDIRFCRSMAAHKDAAPPCRKGTIAAAIFANNNCDPADRLGQRLVHRSQMIGPPGLAFRDALIAQNRALIDGMFSD